jgi:alpha-beta hydrolase superfamily lysophospholipase
MSDSYLSPLTTSDGDNIAVQDWPFTDNGLEGDIARGTVLIVHGLGEHAQRYALLADDINQWGYTVRSYDQYGHGESAGQRGGLSRASRLLDDLADVVDSTRRLMNPGEPLILLGHSLGGVVATQFVLHKIRQVEGLILSSPAFDVGLSTVQKLLLSVVPKVAPNLSLGNGLKRQYLCRDSEVIEAYNSDPLVHDRISPRLAHWLAVQGKACITLAPTLSVPTLLMFAGTDHLVSEMGCRVFADVATRKLMTVKYFEPMYHEILNDPEREQVLSAMLHWLEQLPIKKPAGATSLLRVDD